MKPAIPLPRFDHLAQGWQALTGPSVGEWLRDQGTTIAVHDGEAWRKARGRFWIPAHHFQAGPYQARPPRGPSPGHWIAVNPAEANAHIPWTMVDDLESYGDHRISDKKVRHRIRRASEAVDCIALDSPDLLLEQGWRVAQQASRRSRQPIPTTEDAFAEEVRRRFSSDPQLVLAIVCEDRLLAWMLVHAFLPVMSTHLLYIGDEGYQLDIGVLLYWAALTAGSALPGVTAAGLGPYYPEKPSLAFTKSRFGGHLVDIPVHSHLAPGLGRLLRRHRPVTCARLGGRHRDDDWGPELAGLPVWDPARQAARLPGGEDL